MNFDTRTVIDIVKFDHDLIKDLKYILTEEQKFSEKIQQYDYDIFVDSISPLIKDKLKLFFKTKLKEVGLPILKGLINIENVDYKIFVNEIQKDNT